MTITMKIIGYGTPDGGLWVTAEEYPKQLDRERYTVPLYGPAEPPEDFRWGKVIATFHLDVDGHVCRAVKYHPWKVIGSNIDVGTPDMTKVLYHNPDHHHSDSSIDALIIRWLTRRWLGLNQNQLADGIVRALSIPQGDNEHD